MKKFQFRLEAFLRYKKYLEHKAKLDVAKASSDIKACEEKISNLENEYENILQKLEDEITSGIAANKYLQYNNYLSNVESLIEYEKENLKKLFKILEEKQKELSKKLIEKKTIETLKESKKEEYYNDIKIADQKDIDDIIIVRNARKADI